MLAKAKLAQQLLFNAWEQSVNDKQIQKPWPWADIYPVGLLSVPELNIKQVVLNNQQSEALAFGPGMLAMENTRVLSGHRDSHFAFLQLLSIGNELYFTSVDGGVEKFTVTSVGIVDIHKRSTLSPPLNSLTLVTCFPFEGLGSHSDQRFVVVAQPEGEVWQTSFAI